MTAPSNTIVPPPPEAAEAEPHPEDPVLLADWWRIEVRHPSGDARVAVVLNAWMNDADEERAKALVLGLARQAQQAEAGTGRWYHEGDAAVWQGAGGCVAGRGAEGLWPGLVAGLVEALERGAVAPSRTGAAFVLRPLVAGKGGEA